MGKKSHKIVIIIGTIVVITILTAFSVLMYLMSTVKPRAKIDDGRLSALNYLPDPGPIVPGLLKATPEEIEEYGAALRINEDTSSAQSEKILQKIREKLNRPDYQTEKRVDVHGNVSYVVIKVFDEKDQQKVEIKVRSSGDTNDTVRISTKDQYKGIDSNVEVLVMKNETVVIGSTLPPDVMIDEEAQGFASQKKNKEVEADGRVKSPD